MTVKELKEELSDYPDNMQVFVGERKTGFKYGLINSVYSKVIPFMEDEDELYDPSKHATENVLILDEE